MVKEAAPQPLKCACSVGRWALSEAGLDVPERLWHVRLDLPGKSEIEDGVEVAGMKT